MHNGCYEFSAATFCCIFASTYRTIQIDNLTYKQHFLLLLIALFTIALSCKKDTILDDPSAKLELGTDTLTFDTVFTTVGSTTKFMKVFNRNNQPIEVSAAFLAGGEDSQFRLNIDGESRVSAEDIVIEANDSLYFFVEVTVDPNEETLPYLISDSIMLETNGNIQTVRLLAYGQNANFYGNVEICDEVWTNELPYVLYDIILVPPDCNLTIEPGTRIYSHVGSRLYVQGTLEVNGGQDTTDMVIFQGDRLEEDYEEVPGQWEGIHILRGSTNNRISGAIIKNALWGVRVDSLPENPPTPGLVIENVIMENMQAYGIWGRSAVIEGRNLNIFDCGLNNTLLELGGLYNFEHCTMANYGGFYISHKDPILRVTNYLAVGQTVTNVANYTSASFTNCIILGSEQEEISLDNYTDGSFESDFNYAFNHCIVRSSEEYADTSQFFENCLFNPLPADTMFMDYSEGDLRLNALSPAVDSGDPFSAGTIDLFGNVRDGQPDIGAYELQ